MHVVAGTPSSEDNIAPSDRAVHADLLIGLQVSIEIKRHIGAAEILNGDDHDLVGLPGELLNQRKLAVAAQVENIETSFKIFNPVGGLDAIELRVA